MKFPNLLGFDSEHWQLVRQCCCIFKFDDAEVGAGGLETSGKLTVARGETWALYEVVGSRFLRGRVYNSHGRLCEP